MNMTFIVDETVSNGRTTIEEVLQRDSTFRYQLLSRLQVDCKYYLGFGHRNPKYLWAGDENSQIEFMIALYNSFGEDGKPEWLTMDEILEYGERMLIGNLNMDDMENQVLLQKIFKHLNNLFSGFE